MFSFHKPKIYRSLDGCCICCAKSSSSRFTDSRKYEADFQKCFRISELRSGEICNACVLLVKRWKKLPPGSNRDWHHVVDARAGPGTKSISKIKSRAETFKNHRKFKHKHRRNDLSSHKHTTGLSLHTSNNSTCRHQREQCSQKGMQDLNVKRTRSTAYTPPSPTYSDGSDESNDYPGKPTSSHTKISSFLDLSYWKRTTICCGIIFKGPNGEVIVDPSLLHPCRACKTTAATTTTTTTTKTTTNIISGKSATSGVSSSSGATTDRNNSDGESNASSESRETAYNNAFDSVAKEDDSCHGDDDDDAEDECEDEAEDDFDL